MNTSIRGNSWLLSITVAFLAVSGVGAGIFHFFNEPYNPAFLENPNVVKFHAGLGAIYLGLAPLQFVSAVRSRWPAYHRIAGRILSSIALVIGLTAIFIALFMPFSGLAEQIVISIFGVYFVMSLVDGFVCIRNREIAAHREWMIRAFSIGLSIATMRLLFIPALIVLGTDDETVRNLSIISFTVSFVVHALFAEYWIRRTGKNGRDMNDESGLLVSGS